MEEVAQPKYQIGHKVKYKFTAEVNGIKISEIKTLIITGLTLVPTSYGQTYDYLLSESLPGAYWDGGKKIANVSEKVLDEQND